MNEITLAVIGGGNMAEAILRGGLDAGVLHGQNITVAEPRQERREELQRELGVRTTASNTEALAGASLVLLSVKPQVIDAAMSEIGGRLSGKELLVSVAAGVPISRLAGYCDKGVRIIRTMPNTPMLAGRGMVGLSRGPGVSDDDVSLVREVLGSVARVLELPEDKLDAVTAVSGSGPAYFFLLTECLAVAGEQAGLTAAESAELARETFIGAARLLDQQADVDASELRRRVTSPGGTTAAALAVLSSADFAGLIERTVQAARDRSMELGRQA